MISCSSEKIFLYKNSGNWHFVYGIDFEVIAPSLWQAINKGKERLKCLK